MREIICYQLDKHVDGKCARKDWCVCKGENEGGSCGSFTYIHMYVNVTWLIHSVYDCIGCLCDCTESLAQLKQSEAERVEQLRAQWAEQHEGMEAELMELRTRLNQERWACSSCGACKAGMVQLCHLCALHSVTIVVGSWCSLPPVVILQGLVTELSCTVIKVRFICLLCVS